VTNLLGEEPRRRGCSRRRHAVETKEQTQVEESAEKQPAAAAEQPRVTDSMILVRLHQLPYEQKKQVFDFVEFLVEKYGVKGPRKSLLGLWADLGVTITEEDIAEARREMWGGAAKDHS
jgi:hypothetical protein